MKASGKQNHSSPSRTTQKIKSRHTKTPRGNYHVQATQNPNPNYGLELCCPISTNHQTKQISWIRSHTPLSITKKKSLHFAETFSRRNLQSQNSLETQTLAEIQQHSITKRAKQTTTYSKPSLL